MKLYIPAFTLMAACTPPALCDREAQEWNKFDTPEDTCEAAPITEARVPTDYGNTDRAVRILTVTDVLDREPPVVEPEPPVVEPEPDPKPPVKPQPPKDPDCKGCQPVPDCKGC